MRTGLENPAGSSGLSGARGLVRPAPLNPSVLFLLWRNLGFHGGAPNARGGRDPRAFTGNREEPQKIIDAAEYNSGVRETLSELNREWYEPVLISGGFRELAARPQRDFKIVHAFAACEYLFGNDGSLQSYNLLPCDFEGKMDFILLMLREYRLGEQDWVFVGDGKNDVPIASRAPLSIGYRPHPALRDVATHAIEDFRDLLTILKRPPGPSI